ncbi:MAG TPA: DUF2569 family protein [Gemmatimonadaceae bacterium]
MPFVFLAAVVGATAYLLHARRAESSSLALGVRSPVAIRSTSGSRLVGIRGWLLVYMVGLAAELAHGLALTIGSLVIYAKPSLVGLHSFIPLWALLIYVVSNLGLVAYGLVLFVLMSRERKCAIANNILFNALSIVFLISWFFLSAKSPFGTVVDSLPGLVAIAYFARSRRVRNTFTNAARNNDLH